MNAVWKQTHRENAMRQWRQILELYTYKPRNDKNCQQTTRSQEESRKDSEEAWPWGYLDFGLWPPALGDSNFAVLGHTVCGALLGGHKKLIQLVVRPVIGGPLPSLNPLLHPVFSQPLKFLISHLRNSHWFQIFNPFHWTHNPSHLPHNFASTSH